MVSPPHRASRASAVPSPPRLPPRRAGPRPPPVSFSFFFPATALQPSLPSPPACRAPARKRLNKPAPHPGGAGRWVFTAAAACRQRRRRSEHSSLPLAPAQTQPLLRGRPSRRPQPAESRPGRGAGRTCVLPHAARRLRARARRESCSFSSSRLEETIPSVQVIKSIGVGGVVRRRGAGAGVRGAVHRRRGLLTLPTRPCAAPARFPEGNPGLPRDGFRPFLGPNLTHARTFRCRLHAHWPRLPGGGFVARAAAAPAAAAAQAGGPGPPTRPSTWTARAKCTQSGGRQRLPPPHPPQCQSSGRWPGAQREFKGWWPGSLCPPLSPHRSRRRTLALLHICRHRTRREPRDGAAGLPPLCPHPSRPVAQQSRRRAAATAAGAAAAVAGRAGGTEQRVTPAERARRAAPALGRPSRRAAWAGRARAVRRGGPCLGPRPARPPRAWRHEPFRTGKTSPRPPRRGGDAAAALWEPDDGALKPTASLPHTHVTAPELSVSPPLFSLFLSV